MNPPSIRRRLGRTLCAAALVLMPLGSLAVYWTARSLLLAQFDSTLRAKAQALITAAEIDDEEFEMDFDVQAFAGFGQGSNEDFYQIWMLDGSPLQRSPSLRDHDLPKPEKPDRLVREGMDFHLADGRPARVLWLRFQPADDERQAYRDLVLAVASQSGSLQHTLAVLAGVLAGTGALGLLLTLLLLQMALGRGLRPLEALAAEVAALQPGRPDERLDTARLPAELHGVGEKINDLLGRVQASLARERRFSSHAAHEMRTPLAELKSMMELAVRWPQEATAENLREMLTVLLEMENLLGKLSLLSRADTGGHQVTSEPVDQAATLQACADRFQPEAARRGLTLHTFAASGSTGGFQTDPVLWQAVLNNLVGNAVSHAPTGAQVLIEAAPGLLAVTNPAPELAPEDVDCLFDRFWRKNTGREDGGHSGLGLSIVAACARLMGARCEATLTPAKALRISLSFPESPPGGLRADRR